MDALEAARIEPFLQVLHRLAQDQRVVAGLDAHIVAGGVDPLDRVDVDAEDLPLVLDVDHPLEAVGGRPFRGRLLGQRFRGFGRMLDEHFLQPLDLFGAALLGQPLAHPVERRGKAVLVDRLHQIIDRLRLERAQRMVAISRDEDEQGRLDLHQALDHRKAVEARHLDVEEDEVRLVGLDRADRLAAVRRGGDDLDIVVRLEPQLQPLRRQRLVIDQDGPDAHESLSPLSKGISMITLNPPRSFFVVLKECASP